MNSLLLLAAVLTLDGGAIRVSGWDAAHASPADYPQLLSVYVEPRAEQAPSLLGRYTVEQGDLFFHPRFPLLAGVRYRAVFRPPDGSVIERVFELPAVAKSPTTVITEIYPTSQELPANTLKFYIHFSAPMSRGEAYRNIHLLDEQGQAVDLPFLELTEELWDPAGDRFTLLFSPGRIKRGLEPNREMGPPLVAGRRYTLLIDSSWQDSNGQPLAREFRRSFQANPDERRPVDLKTWRTISPPAGGRQPLQALFPRPLDRALLNRMIEVLDSRGQRLAGQIAVDRQEQRWQFTPANPWKAGVYHLCVDTALEDLAGNKVDRPFDVDVFERVEKTVRTETKMLAFTVK
jgi:hypothetical protein